MARATVHNDLMRPTVGINRYYAEPHHVPARPPARNYSRTHARTLMRTRICLPLPAYVVCWLAQRVYVYPFYGSDSFYPPNGK